MVVFVKVTTKPTPDRALINADMHYWKSDTGIFYSTKTKKCTKTKVLVRNNDVMYV